MAASSSKRADAWYGEQVLSAVMQVKPERALYIFTSFDVSVRSEHLKI